MTNNMNDRNLSNPWNGLRTYAEGEPIYGRNEEIQVLSQLILQSHQTVVYGRSGIGKSSILNAGIFPIVRSQGIFPVYVRFEHNVDKSYLQQIKDAIRREVEKSQGDIIVNELVETSEEETLWEFFHRIEYRNRQGNLAKPLIVFDQFEEIFTLETNKGKINRFFRQLADLINNVMPENLSEESLVIENTDDKSAQENGMLDLGLDTFRQMSYSYKSKSDYHLVFTLREDFLFYLERNTTNIPALKNNRYCLQSISDEQAAEIIMQPRPGLVSASVAELIIKKVTGETDSGAAGIPDHQIEPAILSLFLSRLYDKMVAEGQTIITTELVEEHSANIISTFYQEAIDGLNEKSIRWLEEKMVNVNGRRDNHDWATVICESGLTEEKLKELINEKKLLRQFSYGGSLRVELIHDVLCNVIVKHREERALSEAQKKAKRNLLIKAILIAAAIIAIVIIVAIKSHDDETVQVKIIDQEQNLVLSLEETSTVKDTDFWRAYLKITGKYATGKDTILLSDTIDKTDISESITINTDSCISIQFSLDFGDFADIGKYENQLLEIPVANIMKSPFVKLYINRDLHPYKGRIMLDVKEIELPLENATVTLGDYTAQTDSLGYFEMMMESLPDEKSSILISKGGLGCFEMPANTENTVERNYKVLPSDSLKGFDNKISEIDSARQWNYSTVGTAYCANKGSRDGVSVNFENGHKDHLRMYWQKSEVQTDRTLLIGYFFFKNDKERLDKTNSGKYAYYIGSGYIDRKIKKDENNSSYRYFEFKGYDAAANLRTISGKYYIVKGAGKYVGDITSNKRRIATFGNTD